MKIEEVLALTDKAEQVNKLKAGRLTPQPDISTFKKQWAPKTHDIFDTSITGRPDKTVYYPVINAEGDPTDKIFSRIEKVTRIGLAFQKLIVKRAASFLFGNPVKMISSIEGSKVAFAIDRILKDNKQKGLNKAIARDVFACTEAAEYWYPVTVKEKFKTYGFETDVKLKCTIFSPLRGDTLYPFFDEFGNMAAFSREYIVREGDKDVTYFETWTETKYFRYKRGDSDWQDALDGKTLQLKIGKIPIVYARQESVEWEDVQFLIDRLEKLLSNFGDTNDYHGAPKWVVKGTVKGFAKKGDAGGIIELEGEGADAKVISWAQAPDSIKLEIENLLRMINSLTQTPDISFDAVKGLGNAASGNSLKMLFLDAHLKVMDHLEVFDDYLERRGNILKKFVGLLSTSLEAEAELLELTPEVIPFMVNDEKDQIDNLVTAVSGGILSKKTAVTLNPFVDDTEAEVQLLEEQQAAADESAAKLNELQNEPL